MIHSEIKIGSPILVMDANLKTKTLTTKYVGVVDTKVGDSNKSIFITCLESLDNNQGLFADLYFGNKNTNYGAVYIGEKNMVRFVVPITYDIINDDSFKDYDLDVEYLNQLIYNFMTILSYKVVWDN